jgi:hypothetical protein
MGRETAMNRKLIMALSLVSSLFLFSTLAFAIPVDPIEYEGKNIFQADLDELNSLLTNAGCLPVTEDAWPVTPNESLDGLDLKTYKFEDLNTKYLAIKAGRDSFIYCTAGMESITVTTPNNKGISSYASVPDASIFFLLGPALVALGIVGRKKK